MTQNNRGIGFILFIIFISLFGGIAGDLIIRQLFFDDYGLQFSQVDFSASRPGGSFVIRDAKKVVVEQNDKVKEVVGSSIVNLVTFFKQKTDSVSKDSFSVYDPSESLGQGIVITSDGWVLTSASLADPLSGYVVFSSDKKRYLVDKMVVDKATNFTAVHLSAKDLTVAKFAERPLVDNGQMLVLIDYSGKSWPTYVTNKSDKSENISTVTSSDKPESSIAIQDKPTKEFFGSGVYNLSSECVGLVDNAGNIKPVTDFRGLIKGLLSSGKSSRPYFGVSYVDLSDVFQANDSQPARVGDMLLGSKDAPAVALNSPAAKAGLIEGDVILAINGEKIGDDGIYDILQDYAAGATINIEYQRKGKNSQTDVILGELK